MGPEVYAISQSYGPKCLEVADLAVCIASILKAVSLAMPNLLGKPFNNNGKGKGPLLNVGCLILPQVGH